MNFKIFISKANANERLIVPYEADFPAALDRNDWKYLKSRSSVKDAVSAAIETDGYCRYDVTRASRY